MPTNDYRVVLAGRATEPIKITMWMPGWSQTHPRERLPPERCAVGQDAKFVYVVLLSLFFSLLSNLLCEVFPLECRPLSVNMRLALSESRPR